MKYLWISVVSIILSFTPVKVQAPTAPMTHTEVKKEDTVEISVSKQMFLSINKYCEQYDIPHYIAYNIAYLETSYRGPKDSTYNHARTSHCGAEGPMQIMPPTADWMNKTKHTDIVKLRTDIDFNVATSLKLVDYLWKKYKRWDLVAGAYNTGRPIVNKYARYVSSNQNYKNKWIK